MASPADGLYQISFTDSQLLTALEPRPGLPLVLLPPGAGQQEWQVRRHHNDGFTISLPETSLHVSYDGEPDMHEFALLLPDERVWNLIPGVDPDTYRINVPDHPMNLGMSLLRIYPPHVALAPEYGDRYQAWQFKNIG